MPAMTLICAADSRSVQSLRWGTAQLRFSEVGANRRTKVFIIFFPPKIIQHTCKVVLFTVPLYNHWRPHWQDNIVCFRALLLDPGQKHGSRSGTWHHPGVGCPIPHWHHVHTLQLPGKNIHLQGILSDMNHAELCSHCWIVFSLKRVIFLSCFSSSSLTMVWQCWFVIVAGAPVLEVWKWCFRQRLSKAHCNRIWRTAGPHHSCSVCAAVPE